MSNNILAFAKSPSVDQLREELAQARATEQKFRGLVESAPDAVVVVDDQASIVLVNQQTEKLFGYPRAELLGQRVEILLPLHLRQDHLAHRDGYLKAPGVRPMGSGIDLTARHRDGREIPVEISLSPLQTAGGLLVSASIRDISERHVAQQALRAARDELELRVQERTRELEQANQALQAEVIERRQAESALRASQAKLRLITDNMPAGMAYIDAGQHYVYHNQTFADFLGLPSQEINGQSVRRIFGETAYREIRDKIEAALSGQATRHEHEQRSASGAVRRWAVRYSPHIDAQGGIDGCMAMLTDVTEQRQAEQALFQAQKMEAVGQLTGGVAHDFNNLLTVVLGNLQILASELHDHPVAPELIEAATKAARRGAELNRTLLAFSRRQRLAPAPVAVTELITGMADMLSRTLGEHIQVNVASPKDLPAALADPGQLETALLNLAVNARDAMPGGGKLTVETAAAYLDEHYASLEADVRPGPYVLIAVSDSGTGMTAEVRQRACEPFFTTKDTGKGSGLGLAMVYGFVKQSGGHLKIYSELGHGTTVKIYLPTSSDLAAAAPPPTTRIPPPPTGDETILVVEDEADVRALVCRLLTGLGYRVLEAADGTAGLAMLQREAAIDLLFTDVVLPGGITGPELASAARRQRRAIKVLYTSGYTGNAIQHLDALATDFHLISKPYRIAELAHMVRRTLDGTPDRLAQPSSHNSTEPRPDSRG
ncbi:MAG: hybrid sensor histidine kinase/response regulator [Proteobacteria bacterium]|nr:hybrid sensor histidine kinase/response regulator [Pseudomonadota bacterium]